MLYTSTAREFIRYALNHENMKSDFFRAFKERLEPNIKISPDNLYEKIIDENLKGPAAYHNLIQRVVYHTKVQNTHYPKVQNHNF